MTSSLLTCLLLAIAADQPTPSPGDLVAASGVQGGLVVYLGADREFLSRGKPGTDRFLVHCLCRDPQLALALRAEVQRQESYGPVSVRHWHQAYLPYADNLVNLLIADDLHGIPQEEILRVLVPRGVAYVKGPSATGWTRLVKPWPAEIDQWTHFLHGPDNNAVAADTRVGLPRHVQWIGDPKYARAHEQLASVSAMVSAEGRLFCIIDEGVTADVRLPARWRLVARDAFNGVVLWKRKVGPWMDHLHGFRSGPPDLPFRLVAVGQRVFVTLGIDQGVTALDAATGEVVATIAGSENTRQILHTGERLVMLAGSSQVAVHMDRLAGETPRRTILVANPQTGKMLWRKDVNPRTLLPLVTDGNSVLYQTDEHLACLDLETGTLRWQQPHPALLAKGRSGQWLWATPTLTTHAGVVYVADFRTLSAFSIDDGHKLWDCSSAPGFNSPPDIFVIHDQVWRGTTRARQSADFQEGLNARTGAVETTLRTQKAWDYATLAHHRCYRPKATSRFILSSRSGVEFIDVQSGNISPNHWVRGTCQYGVLPANGLLYAPPHSCACNIKTMVRGTYALAASQAAASDAAKEDPRLVVGPAWGNVAVGEGNANFATQWPTFRHDMQRSGRTPGSVPAHLQKKWQLTLGGRLSSLVASQGRLLVAQRDTHTVHALDMASGQKLWSFTAGGPVDSPPTLYHNMALFGSADGCVYCLRAADGELVWRFRIAPQQRLIVARGRLESAWPVPGSVLVVDDQVIAAAGRSSYLDGGIHIAQLQPDTGKLVAETVINSLDPQTGEQPAGGVDLRGVLNDVLAASGDAVYMRHLRVDFQTGDDLQTGPPHLFAPMGFLDDAWWHRSYWLFASDPVCMPPRNESGWAIWARMGNMVPSGRILSVGDKAVFGYGRDRYPGGPSGQVRGGERYQLFAIAKQASAPLPSYRKQQHLRGAGSGQALGLPVTDRDRKFGEPSLHRKLWSQQIPIFARALVVADQMVLAAGPLEPAELRTRDMSLPHPEQDEAAFRGQRGDALCLVDAERGVLLNQVPLGASPVFDGMIVADRHVFIAAEDGTLTCFGPQHGP